MEVETKTVDVLKVGISRTLFLLAIFVVHQMCAFVFFNKNVSTCVWCLLIIKKKHIGKSQIEFHYLTEKIVIFLTSGSWVILRTRFEFVDYN